MKNVGETGRDPTEPTEPQARIQSFAPEWQESTVDCIRETRRAQYGDDYVKPIYKEIKKNFQRASFPEDFFIALDPEAQRVVGNIGLRFVKEEADKTRIGQVRRFNVLPSFQGKRIGFRLITHSLDFARANNYKEIYLTTESDEQHAKAREMYEKFRFKIVKLEEMPEDDLDLILTSDDKLKEIKNIEAGKTLIYKFELEKDK